MEILKSFLILQLFLISACSSKPKSIEEELTFDHTFKVHEKKSDFFSMEKLGFKLMAKPVIHPGPVECRFINFKPKDYPSPQYLEWCYTPDFEAMKKRMLLKDSTEETRTGVGFRTYDDINKIFNRIKPQFAKDRLIHVHKNFEWQKNDKDILQGWDYISFKGKPVLPDLSLFGVKYGDPKKKMDKQHIHKNTADKIIGIILDMGDREFKTIAQFSGDSLQRSVVSNPYGFHFIQMSSFQERAKYFKAKALNFKAVILRIKNVEKFKKHTAYDYEFKLYDQTFYGVKLPKQGWDILFTASDEFATYIKEGRRLFTEAEVQWNLKIRDIYNSGKMEQAFNESEKFLATYPNSELAQSIGASIQGDAVQSGLFKDKKEKLLGETKATLKKLFKSKEFHKFTPKLQHKIANEYFWFFEKHIDQYKLGLAEIKKGNKAGHYSATVGSSMQAYRLAIEGRKTEAEKWANKALKHYKIFEKFFPDLHNINWFSAQAYAVLGQYDLALKNFKAMSNKSGEKHVKKEDLEQFLGKISALKKRGKK